MDFGFPQFAHVYLPVPLVAFSIPPGVFWAYFAGVALLAIGLPIVIKNDLPQAHGLDKFIPFGRLFYALPLAIFATEHFTFTDSVMLIVPSWIPAHRFWVYFVAVALIAAALSITFKVRAQLASTLLGIMLFLFVVLIHIPNVVATPHDRIRWAVALRDLAFSGGAFAFAGCQAKSRSAGAARHLITLGRILIAIAALFFAVEHFLHPDFVPGVPLNKLIPTWIPGRIFVSYLAGTLLLASGACLLINKKSRLAATYLGILILFLCLYIYLPLLVSDPSSISGALNFFVDTLMFSGAAFLLADALPKEHPRNVAVGAALRTPQGSSI
jgi:uncharacterized membrane protein